MMNRKAARRARRARRIALTVALMALVAVISIGGTIAWLSMKTDPITNTFTVGDVTITLNETKGPDTQDGKSFKMVPGNEIAKDPKVTVVPGSEACYVFVKVTKMNKPDDYLTYSIDSANWTELDATNYPGVYYKDVDAATATAGATYSVLTGDKVTVKAVTDADMVTAGNANPKLTFKAYAIQSDNMDDAADAWTKLVGEIGE